MILDNLSMQSGQSKQGMSKSVERKEGSSVRFAANQMLFPSSNKAGYFNNDMKQ